MTLPLALVIRLLSLLLSFENTHIVSGDLPSRLAGLPLPEGTQVVVSYVRRDSAIGFSAGVELDTPLAPDTFYGQMEWRLARGGWKPVRVPIPAIGPSLFESNDLPLPEPGLAGTPFFQKDGLTLTLNYPTDRPNRLTRAYFQVESGDKPIKSLLFYETTGPINDLLPSLTVPKGSELGASSTSEGGDYLSASTAVTTNMSPTDLAEHFAAQLSAADWRVTQRRSGNKTAFVKLEYDANGETYDAQLSVLRSEEGYSIGLEASRRSAK